MSDDITRALQAAFPEKAGDHPSDCSRCGQAYERFDLLAHLQNVCPNPPFKDDVLAGRAYRMRFR